MVVLNQQRARRRSPAPRPDRPAVLTLLGIVTARAPAKVLKCVITRGPTHPAGAALGSHGHFSSDPCRTHQAQPGRSGAQDPDQTAGVRRSLA
jgi:hypothetical protein